MRDDDAIGHVSGTDLRRLRAEGRGRSDLERAGGGAEAELERVIAGDPESDVAADWLETAELVRVKPKPLA